MDGLQGDLGKQGGLLEVAVGDSTGRVIGGYQVGLDVVGEWLPP